MPDEALLRLWEQRWPLCPPIAHELKSAYPDRWVRFHSLPKSKRYPDTEAEYAVVLGRYNTVLDELFHGKDVYVITPDWSGTAHPGQRPDDHARWLPGARHWVSVPIGDDPEEPYYTHLFVSRITWRRGEVDELLRAVADDAIAEVIITDVDLHRIHHPYDGGADVLLTTSAERDQVRSRHADWLSAHPNGL
ncbi:DUF3885 domain-containing protein [Allokutzneria oryzae]|uniref:DUF3885 domain-containing protein n=1 Tax=Allokutzneria oryzae TaxID=1378989 RepID=A0ABV6A6X5_9PSEU